MQFLPIAERELREAARHSKTWWRRVLTLAAGLGVFGLAFLTLSRFASGPWVGQRLFIVLMVLAFLFALLAGPLATADCISRERREGTLGLLFLTDLRSYDIVLGKLVATSLDMVLGLAVLLPVAALPFLMGGLSLNQFEYVALTLANTLVLSLAAGLCASSLLTSPRAALASTVGFLLVLALGLPMFVEGLGIARPAQNILYLLCPSFTLELAFGLSPRSGQLWQFWGNLAAEHALAWMLIVIACRRTGLDWREREVSPRCRRWHRWIRKLRRRPAAARLAWRDLMLERNPVAWLEGRDLLQERVLWALCLGAVIFLAVTRLLSPVDWPSDDWLVTWGLCSQYVFCLWLGIQAPRRMAEDKQSGALELLLCTPMTTQEIVRGNLMVLRRRFGRAMLLLVGLDAFLVHAYKSNHGGWSTLSYTGWDGFSILICVGIVVFPAQAWSLARLGPYQGLVSSSRGPLVALAKVALLPWVLFVAFVIGYQTAPRYWQLLGGMNDTLGFGSWALIHLLTCLGFVLHAQGQLGLHFRALAASQEPWWKRLRITWLPSAAIAGVSLKARKSSVRLGSS